MTVFRPKMAVAASSGMFRGGATKMQICHAAEERYIITVKVAKTPCRVGNACATHCKRMCRVTALAGAYVDTCEGMALLLPQGELQQYRVGCIDD